MREKLTKLFGSHLINLDMLPDNPVIIDAGACQGNFIDDVKKHVTDQFVTAIEPNTQNFADLSKKYKNMFLIKAVLVGSGEPKSMEFAEFQGLPEWGNVSGLYSNRKHKTYQVKTITIKEILDSPFYRVIHYLKMDIEGSEWGVVKDMTEETAGRIQQISMEIHTHGIDIRDKLESLGYQTYWENGENGQGELYAVRQEL